MWRREGRKENPWWQDAGKKGAALMEGRESLANGSFSIATDKGQRKCRRVEAVGRNQWSRASVP